MLTMRRNSKPEAPSSNVTHQHQHQHQYSHHITTSSSSPSPSPSSDSSSDTASPPLHKIRRGRSRTITTITAAPRSPRSPASPASPPRISFDTVMSDPKYREVFKRHLRSQHNPEHILFLEQVEEYKRLALKNRPQEKIRKGMSILDEFFEQSSRYALNINREEQMTISALFKQRLALDQEPEDTLFDKVLNSVLLTLKMDSFPRFQNSGLYRMMVEEKSGKKRRRFF